MKMPHALVHLLNKIAPQKRARKPAAARISACHVGVVKDAPLSPPAQEDLKNAWAEVEAAAKESGVIRFHACSRTGQRWQNDPESVRAVAALLRER